MADDQLAEYETQLASVEELLQSSPDDESLLALQNDLLELIAITKQSAIDQEPNDNRDGTLNATSAAVSTALDSAAQHAVSTATEEAPEAAEPPPKKAKTLKEFQVPEHLIPLETDSEAEKNRKRRAIKALKSKWRAAKKESESEKKQKSWQSFQKKKKIKDKSMFSTAEGDAKVGVVSGGRQLTDFGGRKRHKHA